MVVHTAIFLLFSLSFSIASNGNCPQIAHSEWLQVSSKNRQPGSYVPHRRSLMRDSTSNLLSFGMNGGPSGNTEGSHVLRQSSLTSFVQIAAEFHEPGEVLDDMDFVMDGDVVRAYGVTDRRVIVEDTLHESETSTMEPAIAGLNVSNLFIGSIINSDHNQFMWFTSTELPESVLVYTGQFARNGWVGPWTYSLQGSSYIDEMHAAFLTPTKVVFVASVYTASNTSSYYEAAVGSVDMATYPFTFEMTRLVTGYAAADIWVHPTSGDVHAMMRSTVNNDMLYAYRLASMQNWEVAPTATQNSINLLLPGRFRLRFSSYGDTVALYVGSSMGFRVVLWRVADIVGASLNFNDPCLVEIATPISHFSNPGAIFVESKNKQTAEVGSLDVALVGMPPDNDNLIVYRSVSVDWSPVTTLETKSVVITTSTPSKSDAKVDVSSHMVAAEASDELEVALIIGGAGGALLLILLCVTAALVFRIRSNRQSRRRDHHSNSKSRSRVSSRQSGASRGPSRGASRALTRHTSRANAASVSDSIIYTKGPVIPPPTTGAYVNSPIPATYSTSPSAMYSTVAMSDSNDYELNTLSI